MIEMNILTKVKAEVNVRKMIRKAKRARNAAYDAGHLEVIKNIDNDLCDLFRAERYLWTGTVR